MTDFVAPTQAFERLDERVISLLRYWDELRAGRPVPGRVEISPTSITRHLSRICIIERPRAGTVRIRLAGATISSRMGMELRGMPFRSLFDLNHRSQAMDAIETAMITPAISVLSLARSGNGGAQYEGQMIILPLSDTRGALTRAVVLYSEAAAATPYVNELRGRFEITEHMMLDIPDGTDLPGLSTHTARPAPQKPKLAHVASQVRAQIAPRVVASELNNHERPVFQVIDGGLS